MRRRLRRPLLALCAGAVLAGCTCGGTPAEAPPAATPVEPPAPATPALPPNPTTLTLDAPPVTVRVDAMPTFSFTVTEAGEYQFDAVGMPADAQVTVYNEAGWSPTSDGDSGEGLDARAVGFLATGAYTVRVFESQHGALSGTFRITRPGALPAAGALALDAEPIEIESPAAEADRASQAELALSITVAGPYVLRAAAVDPATCQTALTLVRDGAVVGTGTAGGAEGGVVVARVLEPGAYAVRVRDTSNRACTHRVRVRAGE